MPIVTCMCLLMRMWTREGNIAQKVCSRGPTCVVGGVVFGEDSTVSYFCMYIAFKIVCGEYFELEM